MQPDHHLPLYGSPLPPPPVYPYDHHNNERSPYGKVNAFGPDLPPTVPRNHSPHPSGYLKESETSIGKRSIVNSTVTFMEQSHIPHQLMSTNKNINPYGNTDIQPFHDFQPYSHSKSPKPYENGQPSLYHPSRSDSHRGSKEFGSTRAGGGGNGFYPHLQSPNINGRVKEQIGHNTNGYVGSLTSFQHSTLAEMEAETQKMNNQVMSLNYQNDQMQEELSGFIKRLAEADAKLVNVTSERDRLYEIINEMRKEEQNYRKHIEDLYQQVEEAHHAVRDVKTKAEHDQRELISHFEAEMSTLQAKINESNQSTEFVKKDNETKTQEIETMTVDLKKLTTQINSFREHNSSLEDGLIRLKTTSEALRQELAAKTQEIEVLRSTSQKQSGALREDYEQIIKGLRQEIERHETCKASLVAEVNRLTMTLTDKGKECESWKAKYYQSVDRTTNSLQSEQVILNEYKRSIEGLNAALEGHKAICQDLTKERDDIYQHYTTKETEVNELKGKLEALRQENERLHGNLEHLQRVIAEETNQREVSLQSERENTATRLEVLTRELALKSRDVEYKAREVELRNQDIQALSRENSHKTNELEGKLKEIESLQRELDGRAREERKLHGELENLKINCEALAQQHENKSKELAMKTDQIIRMAQEIEGLSHMNSSLQREVEENSRRMMEAHRRLEDDNMRLQQQNNELSSSISELESRLMDSQGQIETLNQELQKRSTFHEGAKENLENQINDLVNDNKNLKVEIQELMQRMSESRCVSHDLEKKAKEGAELKELYSLLQTKTQKEMRALKEQLTSLETEYKEKLNELAEWKQRCHAAEEQCRGQLEEMSHRIEHIKSQYNEEAEMSASKFSSAKAVLEDENIFLKGRLEEMEQKQNDLEVFIHQMEKRIAELSTENEELARMKHSLEIELDVMGQKYENDIANQRRLLSDAETRLIEMQKENHGLRHIFTEESEKLRDKIAEVEGAKSEELEDLQQRLDYVNHLNENLVNEISRLEDQRNEALDDCQALEAENRKLREDLKNASDVLKVHNKSPVPQIRHQKENLATVKAPIPSHFEVRKAVEDLENELLKKKEQMMIGIQNSNQRGNVGKMNGRKISSTSQWEVTSESTNNHSYENPHDINTSLSGNKHFAR